MIQYESMFDEFDSVDESRICVFVKSLEDDGTVGSYLLSKIITTEYAGILFVIDETEIENLRYCKVSFDSGLPRLVRKEERPDGAEFIKDAE